MRYIDLFAGIGGFHLGIGDKGECVYTNEWDKYASQIYKKHFGECDTTDITKVTAESIPDHDLLCGGFPCQAFSIAGKRGGFADTRGTLFFDIARILKAKRPRLCLLENVKGLLSHDNGTTFKVIISTLDELGYDLQWQVLNSKNFGVPQNRERVFIIGQRRDTRQIPIFPIKLPYEQANEVLRNERVYLLSSEISQKYGLLLSELSQSKKRFLPREQMQTLLSEIKQGIPQGTCREIQGETEGVDSNPKGSLQVVEELNSWASCQNKSGEVCGVVQIPTEEVLLLWSSGESTSISFRQIQQQNLSFECGQDRLVKGLRRGEFGTLLFAVQPYQGRLFYSIGNGRDWQNIYIAEVETKCSPTLSSILEEQVDPKYFLSDRGIKGNKLDKKTQQENRKEIQTFRSLEATEYKGYSAERFDGIYQPIQRTPLKFLQRNQKNIKGDYSFTVDGANTGGIKQGMQIRRLTPIECERLQGFPDNWTEGISDTQRYKCLGNAVTVNVVQAIAERLLQ